ncbi:unnamed protein product [Alopecurus aequalis]
MFPRRLLLAVVAVLGAVAAAVAQQPLASRSDRAGLYSLRSSLGLRAREWPSKADPCTAWRGVTCRAGRVVGVSIAGFRRTRLASRAPVFAVDGLRGLTALELFNASRFPLPGVVPAWFGPALPPSLAVLDLSFSAVNGTLPSDLGASGNLTTLHLSANSLSGQVPASLLSVKTLRVLDLSTNNFTGEIPNVSVAAADGAAWSFNISGNSLYGVASYAIGALKRRFRLVDVSSNYLDGNWNGSDATVDVSTNCFYGVPGQRRRVDCEEFYKSVGVRLVDIPAPMPSPQPQPQPSSDKRRGISKHLLIGILAAAAALVLVILVALLFCYMRRRRRSRRQRGGVETNEEGARGMRRRDSSVNPVVSSPVVGSPRANNTPPDAAAVFGELSYEQLVRATGGFGDDNLLKHGHSGDIYHGVLENGANVIVKKIGTKSINKNSSELDFYSRYSHERIVPLLGHVANDDEEFLAYKYMPKADLTNALHKKPLDTEDALPSLDWITRLKIATGIAEAMCFLHDECSPPFVHRDIQASSVLLDDKFEVRLGSMSNICAQQSAGSQNVFSRILRSSKPTSDLFL